MYDVCIFILYISLFYFSLLVFAQKRSNRMLAILMALSFYLQVIVSILILMYPNLYNGNGLQLNYTIAIRHPIVALPIFFMSVFAGVLCTRIQKGDFDALQSMSITHNSIEIVFCCYNSTSTECPTYMLTTSDSIFLFLKPHMSKNKNCFKILVKKPFRFLNSK